jgi:hypothetical protein
MKFRKSLIVVLSAMALGVTAAPLTANAEVGIFLNIAPPPARYEAVPAPRQGYVWSSGYWNAKSNKHVWQAGHWERARNGYHMTQPAWTQRDNRWELQRGRWNKGDRDGDGVPNMLDRAPDNPRRN